MNFTNLICTSHRFAVRSSSSTFGGWCQRLSCSVALCTWCAASQLWCFSWRSLLLGFSLMPHSLLSWAKVVASIVLQRYCPSHDPKQSCLVFWKDNLKLCALIASWKSVSPVMSLMLVRLGGKTAHTKIQVGYNTSWLLEFHRACETLELQLLQSLSELLLYERIYLWQYKCLFAAIQNILYHL